MDRKTLRKRIAFLLVAIAVAGSLVVSKAPDRASYRSYATFGDSDGNGWLFQEVATRLSGRIDHSQTAYASENELVSASNLLRQLTASTRNASGRKIQTGRPGTPSTW